MNQTLYPTKQVSTSDNFQSFTVTNDYTIKRTRYQVHKAKRLGKIFSSEHRKLLSDNLKGNLSERIRIQRQLKERPEGYTKQFKPIIKNFFQELRPVFTESLFLSCSFVSFWILAVILRGVKS
jgi:hypothetical protein